MSEPFIELHKLKLVFLRALWFDCGSGEHK